MLTRNAVISASLQLGQEVGEDGLTMRALATRLGVSATSLYGVFDGKDAIVRELRAGAWHVLSDALAPVLRIESRPERLRVMCRTYLAFARANPWLYALAMDAPTIDELGDLDEERSARVFGPARLALQALSDGAPPDRDENSLRLSVVEIWASLHGLATLLATGQLGPDGDAGSEAADDFTERYIADIVANL